MYVKMKLCYKQNYVYASRNKKVLKPYENKMPLIKTVYYLLAAAKLTIVVRHT